MELITAKHVITIDHDPIADGAVAIDGSTIAAVGTAEKLKTQYPNATIRNFDNHVLMPGLVNAHAHLDLTHFLGDDSNFVNWLVSMLKYQRGTQMAQLIPAIQRGMKQVIDSGTTCVGDFASSEATFQLAKEMGIRTVIFPSIAGGPGTLSQDRYESALALVEKYLDEHDPTIHAGLGPFAPYLLSRHLLRVTSQHAKELGVPLMVHATESFSEMEFFFDSQGAIGTELFPSIGWGNGLPPAFRKTPIQYLNDIGFLDASPTIIGGIHLGARDFTLLARHMCRVVFCPRANQLFSHGKFPWNKLHDNGIPVALGTEATTQPPDFNLWQEMKTALEGTLSTDTPTAKDLMHMATMGGARALGLEHRIGSLTVGKSADVIVVDAPQMADAHFLYDALIRQTTPLHVRLSMVNGHILKNQTP